MCDLVKKKFKLDIYVFSSKLKNPKIQRTIYFHFTEIFSRIEIFCSFVYIIFKLKNRLFPFISRVFRNLFHPWEAMGHEIYKQHVFLLTC